MFFKKRKQEPKDEYANLFLVGSEIQSEHESEQSEVSAEAELTEAKAPMVQPETEAALAQAEEFAEKQSAEEEKSEEKGDEKQNKKAKKSGKNTLINVLIVFFCGVFVVSGALLVRGAFQSGKAKDIYSDVNSMMFSDEDYWGMLESEKDKAAPTLLNITELLRLGISGEVSGAPETMKNVELARIQARLGELKRSNPDIYAFIVIEDTNISYPVVLGEDNEFYLNHDPIYRNYLDSGAIFADWRCSERGVEYNRNTVLYGHNMSRGIMFHDIKKYVEKDFFDTHDIYIYTETGLYVYRPYAFFRTVENHQYFRLIFENDEDYLGFLLDTRSYSMHESDIEVTAKDRILTISTGTNIVPGGRYCLQAKLIRVEQ